MAWSFEEAVSYYRKQGAPKDQTALISLLKEIQQEHSGSIPEFYLTQIAQVYELKETYLQAIVKRIPSLRLRNVHILELCAGPNCGKRTEIADFVEKTYGKAPKGFTFRFCQCMRQCGKGPNLRWNGKVYNAATPELVKKLIEDK